MVSEDLSDQKWSHPDISVTGWRLSDGWTLILGGGSSDLFNFIMASRLAVKSVELQPGISLQYLLSSLGPFFS